MGRNFKENDSVEEEKFASKEDKAGEKLSIFRSSKKIMQNLPEKDLKMNRNISLWRNLSKD